MTDEMTTEGDPSDHAPQVLFVADEPGLTPRYRCDHAAEQLAIYGIHSTSTHSADPALREKAEKSAVVVLHRVPLGRRIRSAMAAAKARGALVLFDTDDLVFEPALLPWIRGWSQAPWIERALRKRLMCEYREAVLACDGCLVPTEFLAARVRAIGRPAWVLRNAFSCEMLSCSEQARRERILHPGKVIIGYASGTRSHAEDLKAAAAAVQEILIRHREAEFWIVGQVPLGSEWGRFGRQVCQLSAVPWQQLPTLLAQFDVNIAPLESGNPFCEAKSENKWMEAALVGVPTVASSSGAFNDAIEHGKTGFLAASVAEWTQHLEALVLDPHLRCRIGEQALAAVQHSHCPAIRGRELIETVNSIAEKMHGRRLWPECEIRSAMADWQAVPSRGSTPRAALRILRDRGVVPFLLHSMVWITRHMPWRTRL